MFTIIETYDKRKFIYPLSYFDKITSALSNDYINLGDKILARKNMSIVEKRDITDIEKLLFISDYLKHEDIINEYKRRLRDGADVVKATKKVFKALTSINTKEELEKLVKEKESKFGNNTLN